MKKITIEEVNNGFPLGDIISTVKNNIGNEGTIEIEIRYDRGRYKKGFILSAIIGGLLCGIETKGKLSIINYNNSCITSMNTDNGIIYNGEAVSRTRGVPADIVIISGYISDEIKIMLINSMRRSQIKAIILL